MKERILVRITRPDFTVIHNTYTNAKIYKDETGIFIYTNWCNKMLAGFYPIGWAVEVVKAEIINEDVQENDLN